MNLGNYNFSGPHDPDKGFREDFAAVYAIVDAHSNLIDVGQTSNINDRFPTHDRKPCWLRNKTGNISLYILQELSERIRLKIESEIREKYKPPCGEK